MLAENMSGAAQGYLFAEAAYACLAAVADQYTTMIGLQHGLTEMNPINKFLFAKIGQPLTAFIEGVAMLFSGIGLSVWSPKAAFVFFGIIAAEETAMAVRNYLLLKKSKISLS